MKKLTQYFSMLILVLVWLVSLQACSDNGTGTENGEAPTAPDLAKFTQPDISFFEDNESDMNTSFGMAASIVIRAVSGVRSIPDFYVSFFPPSGMEARFEDGKWILDGYTNSNLPEQAMKTTAEQNGDGFRWLIQATSLQVATPETIMEGTTRNNNSTGSWAFFLEPGPQLFETDFHTSNRAHAGVGGAGPELFETDWVFSSPTDRRITITRELSGVAEADPGHLNSIMLPSARMQGAAEPSSAEYQQDGVEHIFAFKDDTITLVEVFWNTETGVGYLMFGSEKECWNASREGVSCSEVGL